MEVPLGAGSGFIWDDKGHIVTNYHVVRNAKKAQVAVLTRVFRDVEQTQEEEEEAAAAEAGSFTKIFFGGGKGKKSETNADDDTVTDYARSVYKAKVVGFDPDKDIAVLKIDAPVYDLNPLELGSSKGLKVGQEALAIGK
jgi:S1-C subfamily serine protease